MSSLAEYCRSGNYNNISGVNTENVQHYRRLVFNNVLESLTSAYPLSRKLLKRKQWEELIHRFFSTYKVQHPQIWMMPLEFKDYILTSEETLTESFAFLPDLLMLEWMEIEVFMMPDILYTKDKPAEHYKLNPEIRLLTLKYPVHLKKARKIVTEDKGTYYVLLHRHPETGAVHFTNVSLPFIAVIEHLLAQTLTGHDIATILNKYAPNNETAQIAAVNFIEQSLQNQLIF